MNLATNTYMAILFLLAQNRCQINNHHSPNQISHKSAVNECIKNTYACLEREKTNFNDNAKDCLK